MELKEKAKKQVRSQEKAPIINDRDVKKESESTVPMITEKKKDLIRDVTTIGGYYKAWDQFDIDKEL